MCLVASALYTHANVSCKYGYISDAETLDAKLFGDNMQKTNVWNNGIGYAMATTLLRLPGYAPMLAFNHIVDVPLIVPHAKLSKAEVCSECTGCLSFAAITLSQPKTNQGYQAGHIVFFQRLSCFCHAAIAAQQMQVMP